MINDMDRLEYDILRRTVVQWEMTAKDLLAETKNLEPPTRMIRTAPVHPANYYVHIYSFKPFQSVKSLIL